MKETAQVVSGWGAEAAQGVAAVGVQKTGAPKSPRFLSTSNYFAFGPRLNSVAAYHSENAPSGPAKAHSHHWCSAGPRNSSVADTPRSSGDHDHGENRW